MLNHTSKPREDREREKRKKKVKIENQDTGRAHDANIYARPIKISSVNIPSVNVDFIKCSKSWNENEMPQYVWRQDGLQATEQQPITTVGVAIESRCRIEDYSYMTGDNNDDDNDGNDEENAKMPYIHYTYTQPYRHTHPLIPRTSNRNILEYWFMSFLFKNGTEKL